MSKATNIAMILRGPHKKTLLAVSGCPPIVEIEPLQFLRVWWSKDRQRSTVSRRPRA
jgi:hypothetical protein